MDALVFLKQQGNFSSVINCKNVWMRLENHTQAVLNCSIENQTDG